jgi:hypothetical protein
VPHVRSVQVSNLVSPPKNAGKGDSISVFAELEVAVISRRCRRDEKKNEEGTVMEGMTGHLNLNSSREEMRFEGLGNRVTC